MEIAARRDPTAVERVLAGRSGLYDVTVTCERGSERAVIAEFRGRSRSLGRPHLAHPTDSYPTNGHPSYEIADRSNP